MDGDAKINMSEFALGMKSSLTVYAKKSKRPKSSANINYSTKMMNGPISVKNGASAAANFPIRQATTPKRVSGITPRSLQGTMARRQSSKSGLQRPRTGKVSSKNGGFKPSLQGGSGSMMPRDSSQGRKRGRGPQIHNRLMGPDAGYRDSHSRENSV